MFQERNVCDDFALRFIYWVRVKRNPFMPFQRPSPNPDGAWICDSERVIAFRIALMSLTLTTLHVTNYATI
jgi:hypothetical protein